MWTIKKGWFIFYFTISGNPYVLFKFGSWNKRLLVQYSISKVGQVFVGVQGNIIQYNQKLSNFKFQ